MKSYKKLLALLLALVMLFVACGPSQNTEEPNNTDTENDDQETTPTDNTEGEEGTQAEFAGKTIRFAGLDGGYGTKAWEEVIAAFEEKTGATVEATMEQNIYEVIRPEITAGNAPDVIYNSLGQETALTETMLREGMVMDISDVFDKPAYGEQGPKLSEKLIPGTLDTTIAQPLADGKIYLSPIFYSPTGLWYNKSLFTEDGGNYELPTTMDEFIALGESAKADGISLFTYPTTGYFDTFFSAMIHGIGGTELFNKLMNYDVEAWKNEATPLFETVGKIVDYLEPNTVAQANGEGFTQNQLAVMQNKALFMPNGTWIVGEMASAQAADGFEWGFMAVPSIAGGERYAFSWLEQVFVSKDAKEPELAKAFISYLYSDEAVKLFAANTVTNEDGEEVANPQAQPIPNVDQYIEDENNKLYFGIYNDGVNAAMGGFATAPAVEGVDMASTLYETVNSVANGDKTVEQWQADVVEAASRISEAISNQ